MKVLFYGAGNWAKRNLDRWITEGYEPLCFIDMDEKLHHACFKSESGENEYIVLSPDEALSTYPDTPVYISTDKYVAYKIRPFLISKGIPEGRIFHPDFEWRYGCDGIYLSFRGDGDAFDVTICCGDLREQLRLKANSVEQVFEKYYQTVKTVIKSHRDNGKLCANCSAYSLGYHRNYSKINRIAFGTAFNGDYCPSGCIYCKVDDDRKYCNNTGVTAYEAILEIESLLLKNNPEKIAICIGNAEPFIMPNFDKFLEVIKRNKCKLEVLTSGFIYQEKTKACIESGIEVCFTISLDAGTPETFNKIKRRPVWDRVLENIDKYISDGVKVVIKYIICKGYNDNQRDVEGFMSFASKRNVNIQIARDISLITENMNATERDSFLSLISKIKELQREPIIDINTFSIEDAEGIRRMLAE